MSNILDWIMPREIPKPSTGQVNDISYEELEKLVKLQKTWERKMSKSRIFSKNFNFS